MNTAVIKLTLALLVGVVLGFELRFSLQTSVIAFCFCFLVFLLSWIRARRTLFPNVFFGSMTLLLFILLGAINAKLQLPENRKNHYANYSTEGDKKVLKLQILEILKPDKYNMKYIAEVQQYDVVQTSGKILLLRPLDTPDPDFQVGEKVLTASEATNIRPPLNPHQFDYSQFMARKDVHREVRLHSGSYVQLESSSSGYRARAHLVRQNIRKSLEKHDFDGEELAVVQALLLGQKQDISAETYNNFAAAGAIHILAVSGLHIGIILIILNWMFSPLDSFKKGKITKLLLVLLFLWLFALLAGFSPSVVRAVTMFSFIAVGMSIKRPTSTLNSVFLSLLFLLIINPRWIFEVGFQLSYSAVLAIVIIQPLLYNIYNSQNKPVKYFWGLLTVTIAAQVGVLPLSLYYFHQFPGLFFLSNLIIIPALGFLLIFGILIMLLAFFSVLPMALSALYEVMISVLLEVVAVIARQEQFLFKDISFGFSEMLLLYILLFSLVLLGSSPNYRRLLFLLISIIVLQSFYLYEKTDPNNKLIVFHRSGNSVLGKKEKESLKVYRDFEFPAEELDLIKNFCVGENVQKVENEELQNSLLFQNKVFLIIDGTGVYPDEISQPHYLLLRDSPKLNLERLLLTLRPLIIIADGSNYKSLVARWRETSLAAGIPFHNTAEAGAFILE